MMMRQPPTPPCWPMYPEPERSRLEAAYRAEHEAYCAELDRDMRMHMWAFGIGAAMVVGAVIYAFYA